MKKECKVLHFMCYAAPYAGNFIKSIRSLENELTLNGYNMIYLFEKDISSMQWIKELIAEGKEVYFLPNKKKISFIYDLIKSNNVEIVHTHFSGIKYNTMFNSIRLLINKKITLINHLHNHYKGGNTITVAIKKILGNVDLFIGCSQSVSDHHRNVNHLPEEKVITVPNAIDFTRLSNFEYLDKKQFSINDNGKIFLIFGFDYLRKGVDIAIEAFDRATKERKNIYLMISLSTNKNFVMEKILEKYEQIPEWIKIVDARDDIATFYKSSNAFISSSRSEGFCYSLVEAAFSGIPIIASNIPGQNSLNIPYTYSFENENIDQLKQHIITIYDLNSNDINEMAKIQRKYIIENYDLTVWAKDIYKLYSRFLQNSH